MVQQVHLAYLQEIALIQLIHQALNEALAHHQIMYREVLQDNLLFLLKIIIDHWDLVCHQMQKLKTSKQCMV